MQFGPPAGRIGRPETGKRPYAVVQLRTENVHGTCYNMVGISDEAHLPGTKAGISIDSRAGTGGVLRFGSLHRNTFINLPIVEGDLQLKSRGTVFFAGQLVGSKGYTESAAMEGLPASRGEVWPVNHLSRRHPPARTWCLIAHLTKSDPAHFQPMNTNFGLFPPVSVKTVTRTEAASHPANEPSRILTHGSRSPGFPRRPGWFRTAHLLRPFVRIRPIWLSFWPLPARLLNARGVLPRSRSIRR